MLYDKESAIELVPSSKTKSSLVEQNKSIPSSKDLGKFLQKTVSRFSQDFIFVAKAKQNDTFLARTLQWINFHLQETCRWCILLAFITVSFVNVTSWTKGEFTFSKRELVNSHHSHVECSHIFQVKNSVRTWTNYVIPRKNLPEQSLQVKDSIICRRYLFITFFSSE